MKETEYKVDVVLTKSGIIAITAESPEAAAEIVRKMRFVDVQEAMRTPVIDKQILLVLLDDRMMSA